MTSIGFIGLGAMGGPMARRLLEAGHELALWNRNPSRAEQLVAAGATVRRHPADVARSGVLLITMLADPEALREVIEGPDGVLAGLRPGSIFVDMSTVGPAAVHELAERLPSGVDLVDAPVLGSVPEATSGSLRIFVGGDADVVRRVEPVLRVLGEPLYVGELGSGAAAKLVANSTLFAVLGALGEAILLGDGLGLSRQALFDVLATSPFAAQAERRRESVETGEYPPRFKLSLAQKDALLVHAAASEAGVGLPVAEAARHWLDAAAEAGWSDQDYSSALGHMLGQKPSP